MATPDLTNLQKLWNLVTDEMKKRVTSIAVWQAMEAVVVLDYEEGDPPRLVLGLSGENFSLSGHLEVPDRRNLIESILEKLARRPLSFRLVECGSVEEWKEYKILEERKRAAAMALATGQRPRTEAAPAAATPGAPAAAAAPTVDLSAEAIRNLDDIMDRAYKMYQALPHRTLYASRARFVRDAAKLLAGAEGQLVAAGMSEDAIARTIDRAIDRIAVWGECEGTTVALEYLRCKERG
ncbi:MAG: hypothetical protein QHJ73_17770 [Armatimonadota bacterium]|nr:hypothetical protein [Armatimonadota bacterium]